MTQGSPGEVLQIEHLLHTEIDPQTLALRLTITGASGGVGWITLGGGGCCC